MKTPYTIKNGLAYCSGNNDKCNGCPYNTDNEDYENKCLDELIVDALAYIQQLEDRNEKLENALRNLANSSSNAHDAANKVIEHLESRLAQVERERDAAVADLKSVDEKYEALKSMIDDVTFNHEPYSLYLDFRAAADAMVEHEHADVWCGVCEENTKEQQQS